MTLARAAAHLMAVALSLALCAPVAAQSDDLQEANQLFRQGQLDRALERVDAAIKSRPKDARARFLRGLILTEQGRAGEAIKVFTALTEDYPELPEPYNNLAVLYASQGQYDRARAALEMAIRTHPSYATAHENLGDIYAKMASQAYDKALQLDRGNQAAQTKLNLIRDLFSGNQRPAKPVALKPEPPARLAAAPAPAPTPAPAPAAKPAPAAAPAPAAKPAPAEPAARQPAAPAAAGSAEAVLQAVNHWARAWSSNDVAGYLAAYAPDFKTPDGKSRADWEAQRKALIAKPRKIQVAIEGAKVKFDDKDRVTVTFRQNYRSDSFKASSTKTLVMVRAGDKWLIQQERVGG
jgi:tetratricopeptide (TPR) repeat protein